MDKTVTTPNIAGLDPEKAKAKLGEFIEWGNINFEGFNGNIHANCRAFEFSSAEEMNDFFGKNIGIFNAQIFPLRDKIVCLCNRKVDEEGQAELQDRGDAIRKFVEEATRARREAKEKKEADLKARVAELERLQEVGKKCEHNHGAVIEENQKLKKQLRDLKKGK